MKSDCKPQVANKVNAFIDEENSENAEVRHAEGVASTELLGDIFIKPSRPPFSPLWKYYCRQMAMDDGLSPDKWWLYPNAHFSEDVLKWRRKLISKLLGFVLIFLAGLIAGSILFHS